MNLVKSEIADKISKNSHAVVPECRLVIDISSIPNNAQVQKSTESVRQFDKMLLSSYQSLLEHIFKLAQIFHTNIRRKTKKTDPKRIILAKCAVKCMLLFTRKCSHFNYTKELLKNVTYLTNSNEATIRKESNEAIGALLALEPVNNVTVECVQLVSSRIERKNFKVQPEQIVVFENVPLVYLDPPTNDTVQEIEDKKKKIKAKWRKIWEKKLKQEERATQGKLNKAKQYTRQKIIIESMFRTYFYVLKLEVSPKLLEPALQGMAKFAHLINIELILDLIAVVSEKLAEDGDKLSLPCKLLCISTTFKVLSGRGTSVNMDVRQHYQTIYEALLSVTLNRYEWGYFELIFECLNSMFGHHASKTIPVDRVASFIKRLINISTQIPACYGIACQHLARKLLITDPRLYNMLDSEGGYDRQYDAFEKNPNFSNSLACCLWELTLTSDHWHPYLRRYSRDLSTWSEIPIRISSTLPNKLMNKYNISKTGNFIPRVEQRDLKKYSLIKHPPKDLNNVESMTQMVDWFGLENKRNKKREMKSKQIAEAVISGNETAESVISEYCKSEDTVRKNMILKEIKEEYQLLNELMQTG